MEKRFKDMDVVERIKTVCKERGISIAQLERECGFANAYIAGLRRGTMPADRLQKVANALGLSYWYLLTGEADGYYINPEAAEMAQQIYDNKDLRLLFDVAKDVTPEQLKLLHDLAMSWKVSK